MRKTFLILLLIGIAIKAVSGGRAITVCPNTVTVWKIDTVIGGTWISSNSSVVVAAGTTTAGCCAAIVTANSALGTATVQRLSPVYTLTVTVSNTCP